MVGWVFVCLCVCVPCSLPSLEYELMVGECVIIIYDGLWSCLHSRLFVYCFVLISDEIHTYIFYMLMRDRLDY